MGQMEVKSYVGGVVNSFERKRREINFALRVGVPVQ